MPHRFRTYAIAFRLALLLPLASSQVVGSGALANLSGTWKLNKDLSDDPQQKMKDARSESGGGGGRSGERHGGGMGRGGGGRSGSSGSGDDSSRPFEDMTTALQQLKIEHQDPALTIEDGIGRRHRLFTDGRKVEEERSYGGTTEIHAVWKDGHVVVTTQSEKGPKITETYAVAADGSQLTVTSKIETRRGGSVEIRRVYDAVKPLPAATPTPVPESDDSVRTG
ncbi:MAG TPA: hypothetical protein VF376_06530 [Thermoanaerobaculia bacterium]